MNAHYVFKLSEMFGFYPLAGLSLSFWKAGPWDATRFVIDHFNNRLVTRISGFCRWTLKYNIIKDLDAAALAVRVGYNF